MAIAGFIMGLGVSGFVVFLLWRYKKLAFTFKCNEKESTGSTEGSTPEGDEGGEGKPDNNTQLEK